MKAATLRLYGGGEWTTGKPRYYVKTGEHRPPRTGEFYLSGALPCAYRAPNDLGTAYHIMREATEEEVRCPCCGQVRPIV